MPKSIFFLAQLQQTTFARAAFRLQTLSHSINSCLDSVTRPEDVMKILRSNANTDGQEWQMPFSPTDLVETENGFVYQTMGGTTFGIFWGDTWADVPVEGIRYGHYVVVIGYMREGSITRNAQKAWSSDEVTAEVQCVEGDDWVEMIQVIAKHAQSLLPEPQGQGERGTGRRRSV